MAAVAPVVPSSSKPSPCRAPARWPPTAATAGIAPSATASDIFFYAGCGGGGAGGRIKVLYGPGYAETLATSVKGGEHGRMNTTTGNSQVPEDGEDGTVYYLEVDPDPDDDNILVQFDNCPETYNPVQLDADQDGIGDVCDVCPTPADPFDSDNDTVCDNVDKCPGFDDLNDDDLDGIPFDCDNCPLRSNPDQLNDDAELEEAEGFELLGNACDPCPTPEDPFDFDGDEVCFNQDVCPGFDDRTDTDFDGIPNDCDICPTAPRPDAGGRCSDRFRRRWSG